LVHLFRWSAAKGIGRVCSRLPRVASDDVLRCLIDAATADPDADTHWHGVCLAIAEMVVHSEFSITAFCALSYSSII